MKIEIITENKVKEICNKHWKKTINQLETQVQFLTSEYMRLVDRIKELENDKMD